jgi:SAM-dependent methyltransferase
MLFHIPRIEGAVAEIHRVLRPGGYLLAATNARDSMETFMTETAEACHALGHSIGLPPSPVLRFTLEDGGASLQPCFPDVERDIIESALVFSEVAPPVAYIDSMRHVYAPGSPDGLTWETLIEQVERQIRARIAAQGEYRVTKTTGVFVTTREP